MIIMMFLGPGRSQILAYSSKLAGITQIPTIAEWLLTLRRFNTRTLKLGFYIYILDIEYDA